MPPSCLRKCIDISRSEFVLILWSALKKNADHLIPFLILVANAPTGDTYVTTPCSGLSRVVTPGNTPYWQLAALSSSFGTGLVPLGVAVVTITEKWLPHTVTTIDGFHSIFSLWRLESIISPCCLLIASRYFFPPVSVVKYDPSMDTLNYLSSTLLHLHWFNALLGDEVHRRNHGCYQDIEVEKLTS